MPLRDRFKQTIKFLLSLIVFYIGLVSLYRKVRLKNKAVIVMYHSFTNPSSPRLDYSPDGMTVTDKVFSMHMKYLSKHYKVISLNELINALEHSTRELNNNFCVITFDDGWREVYDYAYPILKKYGFSSYCFFSSKLN